MRSASKHVASAPARVNLIGEHTDYTGGLVLPFAIPFYTRATLAPSDRLFSFSSEQFPDRRDFAPGEDLRPVHNWTDYPVGVLQQMQAAGHEPTPFAVIFEGNVPLASGLSSSASIEVATAFALLAHLGEQALCSMRPEEIALLCQRAENNFVGSPCGIMDQTVITLASKGHALLLHTRDLHSEHVPMNLGAMAETTMVICNSHVKHSVATGEYGNRRRQVEEGQAAVLEAHPHLRDLGDASTADLESVRDRIAPEAYKRCRHIVTENGRVLAMRDALLAGNAQRAGVLMLEAHASERDDFECSCPEIDFLVDTARDLPGCLGARLTGGGFGGCTVNLVQRDAAEAFSTALRAAYQQHFTIEADIFSCEPVDGAMRLAQQGQGTGKGRPA